MAHVSPTRSQPLGAAERCWPALVVASPEEAGDKGASPLMDDASAENAPGLKPPQCLALRHGAGGGGGGEGSEISD